MDRKSILAMILIAVVILTLPYYQKMIQGDQPVRPQRTVSDSSLSEVNKDSDFTAERTPELSGSQKDVAPETAIEDHGQDDDSAPTEIPLVEDSTAREIKIESDRIRVVLSNKGGGTLTDFILKKYSKYDSTLVNMISDRIDNDLFLSFQDINGEYLRTGKHLFFVNKKTDYKYIEKNDQFKIEYTLNIRGHELRKTFIFYGNAYHFDVVVQFSDPDAILLNRQYQFGWKNGLPPTESYESDDMSYNQAYVYMGDELESYSVSDEGVKEPVSLTGTASWLAVRTKYFITSVMNINANVSNGISFSGRGVKREEYIQRLYNVNYNILYQNDRGGDSLRVYIGPLDNKELSKYDKNLDILIMNNGWYERIFRFFSLLILPVLEFLYSFIPNYGVVIIIFSILIKILVYPLTKKSYTSMKQMQVIQPLMAEIKEKYKNDAQRMNKEMMKLYKEHGVNPMGGCLPMLLQMPLLIALFIVFRSTIQLRGATFIPGWINDLSQTDTIFTLPFTLPMYGNEFNLLPILMALTMIFQSKMTIQDPKQKAMVYIMPVFMLLIFNRFPAGLNLYYTMFNLLTIIQQKFIHTGSDVPDKPDKKQKK